MLSSILVRLFNPLGCDVSLDTMALCYPVGYVSNEQRSRLTNRDLRLAIVFFNGHQLIIGIEKQPNTLRPHGELFRNHIAKLLDGVHPYVYRHL